MAIKTRTKLEVASDFYTVEYIFQSLDINCIKQDQQFHCRSLFAVHMIVKLSDIEFNHSQAWSHLWSQAGARAAYLVAGGCHGAAESPHTSPSRRFQDSDEDGSEPARAPPELLSSQHDAPAASAGSCRFPGSGRFLSASQQGEKYLSHHPASAGKHKDACTDLTAARLSTIHTIQQHTSSLERWTLSEK